MTDYEGVDMAESTATLTLTDFLLARIAEDETEAAKVRAPVKDGSALGVMSLMLKGHDEPGSHDGPGVAVVVSPSRIQVECEAKRWIVRRYGEEHRDYATITGLNLPPHRALRVLAAVYADHPDYREEWRP